MSRPGNGASPRGAPEVSKAAYAIDGEPVGSDPPREHALCRPSDLLLLSASAGVVQW